MDEATDFLMVEVIKYVPPGLANDFGYKISKFSKIEKVKDADGEKDKR